MPRPALHLVEALAASGGAPRLSRSHLARPRITRLFDEDWPVVALHAPSGYGKSAVLAEWARGTPARPTRWLTMDAATRTARDPAALRTTVLAHLETAREPIDLVIDAADAPITEDVERELLFLLRHDDRLRLRLATRRSTIFNEVSTALLVDTRVIGAAELAFTVEETRQLAETHEVGAPAEQVAELHERTSGWPFAVRVAVELIRPHRVGSRDAVADDDPFADGIAFVRGRLIDELVALHGFRSLFPTAPLERFSLAQAHFLGADPADAGILDELEARGLGAWEHDGATLHFRLQPLLREELLARIPRPELVDIQRRIARWFETVDVARAFEAAVAGEDWPFAARLAQHAFETVADTVGRTPTTLASLPRTVLRSEPTLAVLAGIVDYNAGNIPRAVRTLAHAVAAGEQIRSTHASEASVAQVWTQGLMTAALRLTGRYELVPPALRSFTRMLERVEAPHGELAGAASLFTAQVATTEILLDRLSDAAATLVERRSPDESPDPAHHHFSSRALAALVQSLQGDVIGTRSAIAALTTGGVPSALLHSFAAVPLHLAAAYAALDALDSVTATAELEFTRERWTAIEMWPLVLHARVQTEWLTVGPDAALAVLRDARLEKASRPPIGSAMSALLDALNAELLLALGRTAEARTLTLARHRRGRPRLAIPAARGHLLAGEPALALGIADEVSRATGIDRVRLDALVIAAAAARRTGESATARRRFAAAVEIAERTGMRLPLVAMPRDDFLELAESQDVPRELVATVMGIGPGFPDPGEAVRLTPREQIVVAELSTGSSMPEIARRLSVSAETIRSQTRSAARKLGVSGRAALVAEARRRGLL